MTEEKRAAGYVRVSTRQQKEEESHVRQRERLEGWAEREGYELVVFEDIAISGQDPERDAYQDMMDQLQDYDAIVVRELSRLGRNTIQVLEDLNRITQQESLEFISLEENIDTTTAMGKHFLRTVASLNQLKADLARERTQEMYRRYQEEGKDWGRPEKLDQDTVQRMLDDREKDISYNALAKIYRDYTDDGKLSPATVRKYCRKYGDEGKHYNRSSTEGEE